MSPRDIFACGALCILSLMQKQINTYQNQLLGGSDLMTLAGLPATTELAGTLFVTTLPAPISAFSPTVIPQSNVEPEPMEAPRLTKVGTQIQSVSVCSWPLLFVARGKRSLVKRTLWPTKTSSSRVTPSQMKVWLET